MPERFIHFIDILLIALAIVSGMFGGAGGGAAVAIKHKTLPKIWTFGAYLAIGGVLGLTLFVAEGAAAYVMEDGAVDILSIVASSAIAAATGTATLAGINLFAWSRLHMVHKHRLQEIPGGEEHRRGEDQ